VIIEIELHHFNNLSFRIRCRTCHCQLYGGHPVVWHYKNVYIYVRHNNNSQQ